MKNDQYNIEESAQQGSDLELAAEIEEIKSRKLKYGTLATLFTVIAIIAVVVFNLFVGYLTDRFVFEFDMTSENLYNISEDTKEVIADLKDDITITVLADENTYKDPSNELLPKIHETLQRYQALSGGKITVRYINPDVNPQVVAKYNSLSDLASKDIIVESSLRFKHLTPVELYTSKTDEEEETTYYVGLKAEQKLTSALLFVTKDKIQKAAFITGHGETTELNEFEGVLTSSNYEVTSVALPTAQIGDDVGILVISAPTVDFSLDEIDKLDAFFARGGNAFVTFNPGVVSDMPNLDAFFREWGIGLTKNVVFDSVQSLSGYPMYVVPTISTDIAAITGNLDTGKMYAVIPGAKQFVLSGTQTSTRSVATLMTSSASSYSKDFSKGVLTTGYDKTDADPAGPFMLAAVSIDLTYDKNLNQTRSCIAFLSSGFISDSSLSTSTFLNKKYTLTLLNFMGNDADAVVIDEKEFNSATLSILGWQSTVVFWILVVALPLIMLIIGIFVWSRRRHL